MPCWEECMGACTGEQGAARRDALCRDVLCRLACLGKPSFSSWAEADAGKK